MSSAFAILILTASAQAAEFVVNTAGTDAWMLGGPSTSIAAVVGDTVVFNYDGNHDVIKMADADALANCTAGGNRQLATNTTGGGDDTYANQFNYTVTDADRVAGAVYFSCSYSPRDSYAHCNASQKLTVTVTQALTATMPVPTTPVPTDTVVPVAVAGTPTAAPTPFMSDAVLTTTSGVLTGTRTGSQVRFVGIPYADLGNQDFRRRAFEAPRPMGNDTQRSAPRSAKSYGMRCPMGGLYGNITGLNLTEATDAECQYINVWGFSDANAAKPVLVYIHEGDGMGGSGSMYDGTTLSQNADAVVVTFNYRLGVHGWFAHASLAVDNTTSGGGGSYAPQWMGAKGNWGLMDMELALTWVQDNAAAFGGDPAKVAIFGADWAVCNILSSPVFNRANQAHFGTAIVHGGGCLGGELTLDEFAAGSSRDIVREAVGDRGRGNPERHDFNPIDELSRYDHYLYGSAPAYNVSTQYGLRKFRGPAVVDGVGIIRSAYDRLVAGDLNSVKIVVGTVANASTYFLADRISGPALTKTTPMAVPGGSYTDVSMSATQVVSAAGFGEPAHVNEIAAAYPMPSGAAASGTLQQDYRSHSYRELVTDAVAGCPAEAMLRAAAMTNGSQVRGFYFNKGLRGSSDLVNLGATRLSEIAYLFGDTPWFRGNVSAGGIQWQIANRTGLGPWAPVDPDGTDPNYVSTLDGAVVAEMGALWGRIAGGLYGAWPVFTTDAHSVITLDDGLSRHVTVLLSAINCNRCDALLNTVQFSPALAAGGRNLRGALSPVRAYAALVRPGTRYPGSTGAAVMAISSSISAMTSTVAFAFAPGSGSVVANLEFEAHLHGGPCASDGDSHADVYRDEVAAAGSDSVTIWVVCDADGVCTGSTTSGFVPSRAAIRAGLSFVVHDTPDSAALQFIGASDEMLCADLGNYNPIDRDFIDAVPAALRTDCQLFTGLPCDDSYLGLGAGGDDDTRYDGGDMAWMWFGTILMVLVIEAVAYITYRHWQDIKHAACWRHKCWDRCKGCKTPSLKGSGPSMPKAVVLDNDAYDAEAGDEDENGDRSASAEPMVEDEYDKVAGQSSA